MESVSGQVSSEFAQEATAAIRSLMSLFGNPAAANTQGLTLRIPLLGKIHIAAKQPAPPPHQQTNAEQYHPPLYSYTEANVHVHPTETGTSTDANAFDNLPDALPWFMELDVDSSSLQDPFIINEFGEWDQWMGAGGMDYAM
jgi:hypothetical protein